MAGNSRSVFHLITGIDTAGAENHLLSLCRGLTERGWDVTVGYLKGSGELEDEFRNAGCDVVHIGLSSDIDPVGFLRLLRHLRKSSYDVIHTHLFHADVYGSVASLFTSIPHLVSSKHNNAPFLTTYPYQFVHDLTTRISDEIITISDFLQDFYLEHTSADSNEITTIHYGLDPTPYDAVTEQDVEFVRNELSSQQSVLVGTVARLIEAKGIDVLLRAFESVRETIPDAHLVVVGRGECETRLKRQARELGIDDAVTFTGFRTDVPEVMHTLDLFVLPSRREGFGLVLLEAMAANTPIVASRVSAIPEIINDGETGVLVPSNEPNTLADAICYVLQNPERANRMGEAGRDRLRSEFTEQKMIEDTAALYSKLLE